MFTRKSISRFSQGQQQTPDTNTLDLSPGQDATPNAQVSHEGPLGEPHADDLNPAKFPPPPVPDATVIGKNFALEGDNIVIRSKGPLAINGKVDADIHCEQLSVGDTAQITGTIAADEIEVHGHVEGTINGAQVILHATAHVDADINSQYLSIERGARFDGRSRRVADAAQIAPQLMTGANDENTTAHNADVTPEVTPAPKFEAQPPVRYEPIEPTTENQAFEPDIPKTGTSIP